MRRTYRAAALAALLLILGSVVEAQHPRCRTKGCRPSATASSGALTYMGSLEIRNAMMYGGFFRVVTVDSGGSGDYTDLGDALAYVASQAPSAAARWTVLVYPGSTDAQSYAYTESALTIPAFTTLQGVSGSNTWGVVPAGLASVKLTGTSGAAVSPGNQSSIVNFGFRSDASVGAGWKMFSFPSGVASVAFRNVYAFVSSSVPDVQLDIFHFSGGSAQMENVSILRSGTATNTRHLYATSGVSVYGGRWTPGTSQAKLVEGDGGTVRFFGTRADSGATVDFTNTSGTLSLDAVSYRTESGTITRAGVLSARHTHGTSLPAACSVPETFTDTTSGAVRECICSASNTWVCNARAQASASAPYACDAGHAGAVYVDTTTPSLCFCTGSAWTTTVLAGDCT